MEVDYTAQHLAFLDSASLPHVTDLRLTCAPCVTDVGFESTRALLTALGHRLDTLHVLVTKQGEIVQFALDVPALCIRLRTFARNPWFTRLTHLADGVETSPTARSAAAWAALKLDVLITGAPWTSVDEPRCLSWYGRPVA